MLNSYRDHHTEIHTKADLLRTINILIVMSSKFVLFRSLQRALDRRLYLLLYGNTYESPSGKPAWHFPEKVYESEETLRRVNVAM